MLAALIAYDADGNVVATLDYMVVRDSEGNATGLIDFEGHELAGGKLRDIWDVSSLDAPAPEKVRAEVAASLGIKPEAVKTLPPTHPFRIAHEQVQGSGTWPEWIGGQAHAFRAELGPDKRITALVHRDSGYRRERSAVEAAIDAVEPDAEGLKDIRHLVGGPSRPLVLDDSGKTSERAPVVMGTPAHLPRVARTR